MTNETEAGAILALDHVIRIRRGGKKVVDDRAVDSVRVGWLPLPALRVRANHGVVVVVRFDAADGGRVLYDGRDLSTLNCYRSAVAILA